MQKIKQRVKPIDIKSEPFTLRYCMTPDFNDYADFLTHCKDQIASKLQSILDFINKKMNVNLHLNIHENGNVSEMGLIHFKFEKECVGEHIFCIVSYHGFLKLKCHEYAFKLADSYSFFCVPLTKDLEIESIHYSSCSFETVDKYINLKFDNLLNLTEYRYIIQSIVLDCEISKFKSKDMMCPYEDEVFLHSLITNYSAEATELFPELILTGVYDFNSADFINRRALYSMTLI